MRMVDHGLGFENLGSQFGDLVEEHCFDVIRGEDSGFVEGFVVGVTKEEGHKPERG